MSLAFHRGYVEPVGSIGQGGILVVSTLLILEHMASSRSVHAWSTISLTDDL